MPLPPLHAPTCFVVAVGDAALMRARELIDELRDAGISTARSFEDRPMKAQFKMADRAGAAFVAVLGDKELAEGVVTLKRLVDGIQKAVPASDVASWLTRLEGWAE